MIWKHDSVLECVSYILKPLEKNKKVVVALFM